MELLTPQEAADRLKVHPRTIKRWAADGKIPAIELPNGRLRIPADAVEAVLTGAGAEAAS